MFRFFDKNFDNSISLKEFRVVLEELDMRFTEKELTDLFKFLDKNNNGAIGYHEFLNVSEDVRLGLDPFANKNALDNFDNDRLINAAQNRDKQKDKDVMDVFQKRKQLFDVHKTKKGQPISDALKDISYCYSEETQKYKFNKLKKQYNPQKLHEQFCDNEDASQDIPKYKNYEKQIDCLC